MRASTLFAVTVAILLGLAAAVTLKVTGFFDKPAPVQPAATVKPTDINVLVSGRGLFAGNLIDAPWVGVRALRTDELKEYEAHKENYLPATPAAVVFRVAAKNIEADKPLLYSDLEALTLPPKLSQRLLPNMRAVNIAAMKDDSAGGLIQVGEWVDVYVTSQIARTDAEPVIKTAPIAQNLRVVAKRNALWNILSPLPDDKPVNFTVEANPYRAALIEFCKTKGTLSLVPVPSVDQKAMEDGRKAAFANLDKGIQPVNYKAPFPANSIEYQDEDARIESIVKGDLNLGNSDLVRIFGIKTTSPPVAPTKIIQYQGTQYIGTALFGPNDELLATPTRVAPTAHPQVIDYEITPPDSTAAKKCKTCGKKPGQ